MKELQRLDEAIVEAGKYLKRLPGAYLDTCVIEVDSVPMYLSEKVIVIENTQDRLTPVINLCLQSKLKYAKNIPSLIFLAKQGEVVVNNMAIEAAEDIEQCIATITQEFEDSYK